MIELSAWTVIQLIGECEMKFAMPKNASGWAMWLYFLFVGLGFLKVALLATLAPWLALAYAVLVLIGM